MRLPFPDLSSFATIVPFLALDLSATPSDVTPVIATFSLLQLFLTSTVCSCR